MSDQVSFDLDDAKALQAKLGDLYTTLWQEWSIVTSQWEKLEQVWQDQQFEQFEPKFVKLSQTYHQVIAECEAYRGFLAAKIEVAEKRKLKLGKLLNDAFTVAECAVSLIGMGNVAPVPTSPQLTPNLYPLTSQVQEQNSPTFYSLDDKPTNQGTSTVQQYEQMPGIARVLLPQDQLNEVHTQAKEQETKKNRRKMDEDISSANQASSSGSPNPNTDP